MAIFENFFYLYGKFFLGIHSIFFDSCVPLGPKKNIFIIFWWFWNQIFFYQNFFLYSISFWLTVEFLFGLKRRFWKYFGDFRNLFSFFWKIFSWNSINFSRQICSFWSQKDDFHNILVVFSKNVFFWKIFFFIQFFSTVVFHLVPKRIFS